jgi:phosphatidylglycerol lysyltransferase
MPMNGVRRALPAAVSLIVFVAALYVLHVELGALGWHRLNRHLSQTPLWRLAAALGLTAINYAVLTTYDLLAFASIGKVLPRRAIAGTAALAYAISHNVGFAMLSGAAIRYRFYARWGVTPREFAQVVISYSVTFWLGLFALGGASLVVWHDAATGVWLGHPIAAVIGWVLIAVAVLYVLAAGLRREFLWRSWMLPLPGVTIAALQLVVSSIDWALAGAVLYVLLPAHTLAFLPFLGAFLVAMLAGMASHVPGGIGVFEGSIVLMLGPRVPSDQLVPSLVIFRVVYYLVPLAIALVALVWDETRRRGAEVTKIGAWLGARAEQLTPRALAAFTFLAGVVLLFSGATPAAPGRLNLLARLLPLDVIEVSHFVGSVAGAGLIVLAPALVRRLDAAYLLSTALVAAGMAGSLLKGFDYEEAALLFVVLLCLFRARRAFDRRAALFDAPFSPGWTAAVVGALGASVWLGFFAYKHVEYSNELWWRFGLHAEASRFLRASVGAAVAVLAFAIARLVGPARHRVEVPSDADLADATRAMSRQSATAPNLVYLRDKALLFNDARDAFVMYGVKGRTWVALGDPVGAESEIPGLIRRFLERCHEAGGTPAFYQVGPAHLFRYADSGLTCVKVGEEAKIDLRAFSLEGGAATRFRQVVRRFEKDGAVFRVLSVDEVPAALPELRAVSNAWLRHKTGAEKGFSLGFFEASYVQRGPVAVIERGGRVQAFSNLWLGPDGTELSLDLMRQSADAPKGVMDELLVHLMVWGRAHGYERLALGMAPLSGVEASPVASLWQRLGALLYEHGGRFYNFQGLRAFKDKFHPNWEPRYLAYPGGLRLPRILADTSALIAGGYRRILLK